MNVQESYSRALEQGTLAEVEDGDGEGERERERERESENHSFRPPFFPPAAVIF